MGPFSTTWSKCSNANLGCLLEHPLQRVKLADRRAALQLVKDGALTQSAFSLLPLAEALRYSIEPRKPAATFSFVKPWAKRLIHESTSDCAGLRPRKVS